MADVEQFVNVRYQGLDLGRRLKIHEFGPSTAYLEHATPIPVGSELEVETDAGVTIPATVLRVQEQVAGAETPPGMRIAASALEGAAASWWSELVSQDDPVIGGDVAAPGAEKQKADAEAEPEKAEAEPAQAEAEPAQAEAEPAQTEAEPANAEAKADAKAGGKSGKRRRRRTKSASKAPPESEAPKTEEMSTAEIEEITKTADEPAAEPKGKPKKRGGRRKKKR